MAVVITEEKYTVNGTTLPALYANMGDWVDAEIQLTTQFQIGSGTSDTCTLFNEGSNIWLEFQQANFADFGFLDGDTVTIILPVFSLPNPNQTQTFVRVVDYIDGHKMYLQGGPLLYSPVPASGALSPPSGSVAPTPSVFGGISIIADKLPNAIEYSFNLAQNGTNSLGSVIDGELTRLQTQDVDTMVPTDTLPMVQMGPNISGSYIKDVILTYVSDPVPGSGYRDFKITFTFFQWGFLKDGFEIPPEYDGAGCLAPVSKVLAFSAYGNPNGILSFTTDTTEANTGYRDENYNGAPNNYAVQSISWADALSNPIEALDNSGTSSFTAVLTAPNQVDPTSTYRMGLHWSPIDDTYYKNRPASLANNLLVIAPENDFIADGVVDATQYAGFPFIGTIPNVTNDTDGAQWDFKNIKIEITAASELTITGDVIPNAICTNLFADVPDEGRKSVLWVSIANVALTGVSQDRVSLTLFEDDNIDAPTLGVQIPNVVSEALLDHDGNDITDNSFDNTTTEDDILYTSEFRLPDNVPFSLIRTEIVAFNTVTDEQFQLEQQIFNTSTAATPIINGVIQLNQSVDRGFNLPPTTDRNVISIALKSSLDIPGFYGVELIYGFLNDWRYWLEQSNVNNDFFDFAESFNGKNKNWQRFYSGDWILRLSYFTRLNGVDDFNHLNYKIRPYEDTTFVTTVLTITLVSTGAVVTNLVANSIMELEYVLTWTNAYDQEWLEVTVEDFEAGNRWVISDVLPQGNVAANPLKPLAGEVGLQTVVSPATVVTAKCLIDTSIISASDVSLSVRVFSLPKGDDGGWVFPADLFDLDLYWSLRLGASLYTGPLIRIRRTSDNIEREFLPDTGMVISLDSWDVGLTTQLGVFCAGTDGRITKVFDQTGGGDHKVQTTAGKQPRIILNGVLETTTGGFVSAFINNTPMNVPSIQLPSYMGIYMGMEIPAAQGAGVLAEHSAAIGSNDGMFWFSSSNNSWRVKRNAGANDHFAVGVSKWIHNSVLSIGAFAYSGLGTYYDDGTLEANNSVTGSDVGDSNVTDVLNFWSRNNGASLNIAASMWTETAIKFGDNDSIKASIIAEMKTYYGI